MRVKILALFAAIAFSGCALSEGSSYTLQVPSQTDSFKALSLPQTIKYDEQTFVKGFTNANTAEYYLVGEKEYGWSKLVSVMYDPNISDINVYIKALQKTHESENKSAKREFSIKKLDEKSSLLKALYYPIKHDKNFDKFEANFSLASIEKCGGVIVYFAQNFPNSYDEKKLLKFLDDNEAIFLKNIPKITCK
ncbi:MAG: hypothetical protein LUC34_02430 [Campylobacter sp.]|nr:hypothetical protein [Campylobacter sp.]